MFPSGSIVPAADLATTALTAVVGVPGLNIVSGLARMERIEALDDDFRLRTEFRIVEDWIGELDIEDGSSTVT